MKRPAFQFYPADWRKDSALQSCSLQARGLWIELVCVMHECDQYGHLSINGKPMNTAQIARLVGESEKVVKALLGELGDAGVFSINDEGCIFSRRMVKDEHLRNVRAEAGRLGGNPDLLKQKDNQKVNQTLNQDDNQSLTPSSSSSSSSSTSVKEEPSGSLSPAKLPTPVKQKNESQGFAAFWEAWPSSDRKGGRGKCAEAWAKAKAEAEAARIIAHVQALKASRDWQKNNGEFIPSPLVYINQRRWDGAETAPEASGSWVGAV